jgi:Spy/CpxP family protein refolding chaperone
MNGIVHLQGNLVRRPSIAAFLALISLTAGAQHQPYAGQHQRELKALSAEEVKQYVAGAGMGYARAAELNHFPGPMHVLELADQLQLSPEQRAATQKLMTAHKAQARALGSELVAAERGLDELFRAGTVDAAGLARAVRDSAAAVGEYRLSHLETHRQMRALLSDEQVRRYDELRGYASGKGSQHKH